MTKFKNLIASMMIVSSALTGCAQCRQSTVCKVAVGTVAAAAVVGLVVVAAKHGAFDGGSSSSSAPAYTGNCECPNETDAMGNVCGNRSAFARTGGATPTAAYCHMKESNEGDRLVYNY